MKKAVRALFLFGIIITVLWSFNVKEAYAYTSKTVSKLVADVDGRNPSTIGRIPLILVHGVHGTDSATFSGINGATSAEKAYFQNFINYFYNSDLKDKYQLYRFHYLSDQLSVKDIGQGLKEWLDLFVSTGGINDTKFVIVAHSMGGLVARSYMQEQQHVKGIYAGQNGGERIEKLITLATPHHGTPGSNGASRNKLMSDPQLWQDVVQISSYVYYAILNGSIINPISDAEVNRSDLRTDNFGFDNGTVTMNDNLWLTTLNQNTGYDNKIKAYYSFIDLSDSERTEAYNQVMTLSPLGPLYLLNYAWGGNKHHKLIAANIVMAVGLNAHFLYTDGMVPEDSAKFAGHAVSSTVKMNNYDHEQMKDGTTSLPNELFDQLKGDLEINYNNNAGTLVAAEYFVDADPGEGNGTAISPMDGSFNTTTEELELSYDTASLTIGVHNLYVRMKNSIGLWGTPRKIPFDVTGNKSLSAAEYYIDTDPGEGQGTPLSAVDGALDQAIEALGVTIDTSSMSTGLHTLFVRAKNSEGHWGTPRAQKFEVLQPPIMASAEYYVDADPGVGNGTAINAEDGSFNSSVEALLKTFNTSSLSIGIHTLYVRARDSYQRWGALQSATFLNAYQLSVARNGNGTGSVTSGDTPQGIICGSDCTEIYNGQSVTLTAVADPGSTFISWTGCTSVTSNTCTVLMAADKSVTALFNDITPPDTAIGSKPNTLTNSASASFTFTATEANSTFECRIDGTAFAACTSPKSYTTLSDGSHTFEVRATDPAGNIDPTPASYTWTVDVTPPDVSINSKPVNPSNLKSGSFTFSSTDSTVTFDCKLGTGSFDACKSPHSYSNLADGSNTFTVRAKDPAGNMTITPPTYTWVIDVTAPTVTVFTIPATWTTLTVTISTLTATDNVTVASYCITETNSSTACSWSSTAPTNYTCTTAGSKTLYAWAKDAAGNVSSPASATVNVTAKAGDCDGNGSVTIAEVQSAINMFLKIKTVAGCVDTNGDGNVAISEVQKVINGFLGL